MDTNTRLPELTPAQRRRSTKKANAARHRVDMEGKPMGRINRLRRRFDRKDRRLQREALKHGAAMAAWQRVIKPGPPPTGGARANPKHPSRKHDVAARVTRVFIQPPAPLAPGSPRRRDRRALARSLATVDRAATQWRADPEVEW